MWKRVRLANLWSQLSNNYWSVPAGMVTIAIGLSFLFPWIDEVSGDSKAVVPGWIYQGGPEGARALLSTIAGSMMTVAALTFSITIVGLSTASQQFGPRLLRNFIKDRGYQVVLGTFLAAFIYCLLVLRTVRSNGSQQFVPYVSLAAGILFAVAGVGVLVYFIHHAVFSMRAETLVAATGRELRAAVDRLSPHEVEDDRSPTRKPPRSLPKGFPSGAREIRAESSGYIQAIDTGRLLKLAHENGLVLRLEHRVGHFLTQESGLLDAWPDTTPSEELRADLNDCFVFGTQRSLNQDVESAVDQLVEIALRALSPGINDPDTAVACIDQLADALGRVGERTIPPALLSYEDEVRLVTYPLTYSRLVDAAFSRIRQYSRGSVPVVLRLLEAIASLTPRVQHDAHRSALVHQAQMIWRASQESVPEPDDLRTIEFRFKAVERVLETTGSS
ncbi:MAG: DUF2254 domain-containing protein [bacterium]